MISTHSSLDTIMRARLADLLTEKGFTVYRAAQLAKISESTLKRWLEQDPDSKDYRNVKLSSIDKLMVSLDIDIGRLLKPVLLDGDLEFLALVEKGDLEACHVFGPKSEHDHAPVSARMLAQGLIEPAGKNVSHRLTEMGRQALSAEQGELA